MISPDYKAYQANKDELIIRQTAIKAAAEIVKARPDLLPEFYNLAEDMVKYVHTGQAPGKN